MYQNMVSVQQETASNYDRILGCHFGLAHNQISQIWPFWKASGLENFDLAFWHFFGLFDKFGLEDLTLTTEV